MRAKKLVAQHRFHAMGTSVYILVHADSDADNLARSGEQLVAEREQRWSRFLADSELSRLNANQEQMVVVSPDTFELIRAAIDAWMLTEGYFDPTVEGSMRAAGYEKDFATLAEKPVHPVLGPQPTPTPQGVVVDEALSAVYLPAGVTLDLGGIGKGAAADAVAAELIANGSKGCVVNIGGDMALAGTPPTSTGWKVRIDCANAESNRQIHMRSGAVCTSTSLGRTWQTTNGYEHHIRNPSTGEAAESDLVSVTIVGEGATQCEVLAKYGYFGGLGHVQDFVHTYGVTGLVVDRLGTVTHLEGFERFGPETVGAS